MTYYSYDLLGNVKTLWQQYSDFPTKQIEYQYDLVSGKVNKVRYQAGKEDQFYYSYNYDAENRLLEAKTGILPASTSDTWSILNPLTDAYYQYYKHGPLARVIIGNNQVQGTDYAYTLSGWLKGINSHYLDPAMDMGGDGKTGLPTATIGKDVIGFALDYFKGDYKPIGTNAPAFPLYWQQAAGDNTANELYNGNISRSTLALTGLGNNLPVGYNYRYDQLNRLRTMRFRQLTAGTTAWGTTPESDFYKEDITYDANGNILSYLRNGNKSATPAMDQLQYQYNRDQAGRLTNNRLRHISDAVPAGNYQEDIDNQVADNYQYDNIGNLTRDVQGNISNIEWTVYGKIKKITKTDNSSLTYRYDASGNRIYKAYAHNNVVDKTWYVRDAQGNVLSVYTSTASSPDIYWKEQHLYGSSRLGIWQPGMKITGTPGAATALWNSEGLKRYELTNHLGNVMATISDKKINGLADVTSVSDYAPFGMQMVGRSLSAGGYRYGFNGKENDNEVKGEGNQQDYGMRVYDPRIGRFLSVDPITAKYPELTPYQFASNTPIQAIDLDGLEAYVVSVSGRVTFIAVSVAVGVSVAASNDGIAIMFTPEGGIGAGIGGGVGASFAYYRNVKSTSELSGYGMNVGLSGFGYGLDIAASIQTDDNDVRLGGSAAIPKTGPGAGIEGHVTFGYSFTVANWSWGEVNQGVENLKDLAEKVGLPMETVIKQINAVTALYNQGKIEDQKAKEEAKPKVEAGPKNPDIEAGKQTREGNPQPASSDKKPSSAKKKNEDNTMKLNYGVERPQNNRL